MLKRITLFLITSIGLAHTVNSQIITDKEPSNRKVIDEVVAQVGNMPILLSDIENQKAQLVNEGINSDEINNCSILEELLYQKMLLNQAKLDSVIISDGQVNAEMENRLRTIEQQIGSREKLEKFYGKTYTQIKDEFRELIRDRMMAQELERTITREVEVSPKDVEKFFNSIPSDSLPLINEHIAIQQIVIYPKITTESRNAVIEKLNGWRKDIMEGTREFSTLATVHSEDLGSAREGGKIEASRGMMVKPFEAAALALNPGEVSEVVETQYGYHIIQLISRKGDDYTVRHILLSPEIGRKEITEAATIMDECYDRLRKNEITWNQAVKEYSEDEETNQNQGSLSNPYTGEQYWDVADINEIDPQIFSITNGLTTGKVSSPDIYMDMMKRKEGVRIVRIKDRTVPHRANLKDDYNFIKKATESNKKSEIISDWINQKIKKTYIRIDESFEDCEFTYKWR
ncbi:MAG TPA: peptidylprolyl isomerase [Brumimicrobium sp.]|nr:peptidylprolyl isomerase [Brumimicrobium sp.]